MAKIKKDSEERRAVILLQKILDLLTSNFSDIEDLLDSINDKLS